MNVLIVHAHNEPQSFTAAMKNLAVEEFRAQGHTVAVSDLYAMNFKAVADGSDFLQRANPDYLVYALEQRNAVKNGTLAPDIAAELEKVKAADLIIFSFPVYWFSVPAILKGWIDRVLVSGYCYGGMRFYDQGGLAGKKAMLACTIGGQPHMLVEGGIHGELQEMLRPLLRGTLAYTGMKVLPPFVAYHVPYVSEEARKEWLARYRERLQTLDAQTPLAFPSMGSFDGKLQPLAVKAS